jgi:hypothetical protein
MDTYLHVDYPPVWSADYFVNEICLRLFIIKAFKNYCPGVNFSYSIVGINL